jgi:hypothetical protein
LSTLEKKEIKRKNMDKQKKKELVVNSSLWRLPFSMASANWLCIVTAYLES